MLKIFICEDDLQFRMHLCDIINSDIFVMDRDMKIVFDTEDPYSLISCLGDNKTTNIYFLDVDLKADINGIELANYIRKLDPHGFIIFITSHSEMSGLTFEYKVEALDYIEKADTHTVKNAIKSCFNYIESHLKHSTTKETRSFTISQSGRVQYIPLDEICVFEVSANRSKIVVLYTRTKVIEFYSNLKRVAEQLDGRFIRCHQSCIVNDEKILKVDKSKKEVLLITGMICPVSRRYLGKF